MHFGEGPTFIQSLLQQHTLTIYEPTQYDDGGVIREEVVSF